MKNRKVIGTICIIITTLAYGLIPSLSFKAFAVGVETETLLFDKFLYAAVLMWALIFIRRIDFRLRNGALKPMIVIMISYIGIATTLYLAFDYISGSLATIISFTYPAIVIAIEMLRGKEKVRAAKIIAVILSLLGMGLIVWSPDMKIAIIGVLFAFLCSLCYTVYIIEISSDKLEGLHPLVTPGYVLAASAAFNFFRCLFSGNDLFTANAAQFGYILILAIVCAFIAILCYCVGVRLIGPTSASIINTFEPACACVFGYFLIGDEITLSMIIGGTLIIVAVLLTSLPDKKSDPTPSGEA
ncbi:MAG: DMT family transporter [Eubacteriales bacterium]|nr:DMT family transporter [Eubacteriales bacterium]